MQQQTSDANQTYAGGWVHDEALQTAATLFHAAALRTTYASEHIYKLDTTRYDDELMGRVSFLALCGDHLQVPPVPKSSDDILGRLDPNTHQNSLR